MPQVSMDRRPNRMIRLPLMNVTLVLDSWENLVWSAKDVNQRKADRLPHEAGLRLLSVLRAPKDLPVTAHLRNAYGIVEWKLFLNE